MCSINYISKPGERLAGPHLCEGSGGSLIGCYFYLRQKLPLIKIVAGEAIQCPNLMTNGFDSQIEGIRDVYVPWILNMRNIDLIVGIDDEVVMKIVHLFNQPSGVTYLKEKRVNEEIIILHF